MVDDRTREGGVGAGAPRAPEEWLEGFPGIALLLDRQGRLLGANSRIGGLTAVALGDQVPFGPLISMASAALEQGAIETGTIACSAEDKEYVFEATAIPMEGGQVALLCRDITLERNLRAALVESRQRYKDIVEASSDFFWETDADGKFVFVSSKGALGYEAEALLGRRAERLMTNTEGDAVNVFLPSEPISDVDIELTRINGTVGTFALYAVPLLVEGENGKRLTGARGLCRDVTDARASVAALKLARKREHGLGQISSAIREQLKPADMLKAAAEAGLQVFDAAGVRIYMRDDEGNLVVRAEAGHAAEIKGLDAAVADREARIAMVDLPGGWQVLLGATRHRASLNGVFCLWRSVTGVPWDLEMRSLLGDVVDLLGVTVEQVRNLERIVTLSRTDALTGLLNRRAFFEEDLPRRIERLDRDRAPGALFYVDLDNFKQVNDVHGHQRGDEVLRTVRDLLIDFFRPTDVVARLGGDEFAVWIDGASVPVIRSRAEGLSERSKDLKAYSGSPDEPLGFSIGVAVREACSDEPMSALVQRADDAMYAVKKRGKGGIEIAMPDEIEDPETP